PSGQQSRHSRRLELPGLQIELKRRESFPSCALQVYRAGRNVRPEPVCYDDAVRKRFLRGECWLNFLLSPLRSKALTYCISFSASTGRPGGLCLPKASARRSLPSSPPCFRASRSRRKERSRPRFSPNSATRATSSWFTSAIRSKL